ncbi:MAG TPA: outer membrane protein assembly factor BamA [Xanthobacteraceae bacterium]|nr:outer membrane protein assembly factor BamA [Xanthobacteraceae bacterium]
MGIVGVAVAQTAVRIDVEGNRRVEPETIRAYFRVSPGERLDAAKIDSALKGLYATGLFQDVRITPGAGRILVTVVENPVINRVAFEGNKKAKDEQLGQEVQSKPRGTYSKATVQADVQRILEVYQRSGRYDVRVVPKIVELPNGRVDLIFEIDEGVKTGVAKIIFVGNKAFSDQRLKDVIKTGETNWLSFLKSNDIYDPDRVEVDRDLLRRHYLKYGYVDIRIVSATGEYDPNQKGFVITFTIEEGDQYHFGIVDIQSNIPEVPPDTLRSLLRVESGRIYNADAVEKSSEFLTVEVAKRGYPFAAARPRGDRIPSQRVVNVVFVVEEGPHTYIERINVRGNTRTRDYVIRREFDIVEGDPYNRALVDRAERRLKNLGYFKTVKITTEPGSAPDRIIIDVDLEEQSTGEFSIAGGYSTSDGAIAEVSVGERNLLGTGQVAKASVQYGQRARGFELNFIEPYILDTRLALGFDVFAKQTTSSQYTTYLTRTIGGDIKTGLPITENFSTQLRYTVYQQEITLPSVLDSCNNLAPNFITTFPTPAAWATGNYDSAWDKAGQPAQTNCYQYGQASLAVRKELAAGPVIASVVGYTLAYNTLDNNRAPTQGVLVEFKQDFAGVGGDVHNVKQTIDARLYNELFPEFVGVLRGQAGYAVGWNGAIRMLDEFQAGPSLVRGFQPAGFGPRDISQIIYGYGGTQDALGGSLYWAGSLEFQTPLPFVPKDFGMKLALFSDAGLLWDYQGPTYWNQTGETMTLNESNIIRSSVGAGLIWDSPFGPLRFDLAYALTKGPYDKTQLFRFGGGTRF